MAKPKMHLFMGSKDEQKAQKVKVEYDPSVIGKGRKAQKDVDSKGTKIGSSLDTMGLASAEGKDNRMFRLELAFNQGKLFTISAAAQFLGVTYATAKRYAMEKHLKIYDDKKKVWLDGHEPTNLGD